MLHEISIDYLNEKLAANNQCYCLINVAVSRDIWQLLCKSKPSDKQAKMVSLKNLFSQRNSNFKFEKFDSAQSNFFDKLAH